MNSKPNDFRDDASTRNEGHPLRALSEIEFAALGGNKTVFVRTISAKDLADFVPEASAMPEDVQFQLIMAADGAPLLVADNFRAVSDWLSENEVVQVYRH